MAPLRSRPTRWEAAAVGLLIVWVTWVWVAGLLAGRPLSLGSPYVVAPVALVAGVALGRTVAGRRRPGVAAAGLVIVTAVLLLAVLSTEGPAKRPIGYANANAALAVQLIGLCGLAMLGAHRPRRLVLWATTAGALAVVAANASKAALAVAVPLVAVVALMSWRPARRARWVIVASALAMATVAVGVVRLAAREQWPPAVVTALDPARQALWSDALSLWAAHPVPGAGPGAFAEYSRLGGDTDTASAHSSILQVGAETGAVGVVLFAVVILAGLLWAARGDAPDARVAAVAWTALVVHSFTDHLLEFVPVVLAAGITIGWAAATRSEELDVTKGEGPGTR